jgi:hypothetical protein
MKFFLFVLLVTGCTRSIFPQELPATGEQELENQAGLEEGETEDDFYLQQLAYFHKHPLDINTADKNELKELNILTDLQIESLISYRALLGMMKDIYELQAIPGWDIITIRRLLPFVTIASLLHIKEEGKKRIRNGNHAWILRASQSITADDSLSAAKFKGSLQRIFFRYRYNYKNLLQYGITAEKDAGEQFFRGAQKSGFDFYSFHLLVRKTGRIETLVFGDFTVNMGQGLVHWQSLAFKKSAGVMNIKRQSSALRPYSSSGEFNFHRGAGITIRFGKLDATLFVSLRKLDINPVNDTAEQRTYFHSFLVSGYHRTQQELEKRNNMRQLAGGGAFRYSVGRLHAGIHAVGYRFSVPLQRRNDPYDLFAVSGNYWYNAGIDYSYTWRNVHLFGEGAIDKNGCKAILNGVLMSVDSKADISLSHRVISPGYQSINGNAFTENTLPSNENGIYAGIVLRPVAGWRLDACADFYKFPWLKYRVDAPSFGKDFIVQLTYLPNRRIEIYTRFKNESKQVFSGVSDPGPVFQSKQNWRMHVSYKINQAITLRKRVECTLSKAEGSNNEELVLSNTEEGFLAYFDFIYKPLMKPFSCSVRLQYFETGGFNSRVYAYENDVLYSYSIPAFSGKGFRYYILVDYTLSKRITCWLRWAQTRSMDNGRMEWKVQVRCEL